MRVAKSGVSRRAFEEGAVDVKTTARITQQTEARARDTIRKLEKWDMLVADGAKWKLTAEAAYKLSDGAAGQVCDASSAQLRRRCAERPRPLVEVGRGQWVI